jgi:hypothetical protein
MSPTDSPWAHWSKQSIAPVGADQSRRFLVTHPHHPLFSQEFELVFRAENWREDRVWFHDARGRLRSLPANWTNAVAEDPFNVVAAGRVASRSSRRRQDFPQHRPIDNPAYPHTSADQIYFDRPVRRRRTYLDHGKLHWLRRTRCVVLTPPRRQQIGVHTVPLRHLPHRGARDPTVGKSGFSITGAKGTWVSGALLSQYL